MRDKIEAQAMTKTEKELLKKYTRLVPAIYRGAWLTDWERKCPCHIVVFNCASHYCRDTHQCVEK